MTSDFRREVWLGYSQTGGRARLRIDQKGRLLVLGGRADMMAALLAYASHEAGLKPLVLDVDGSLSRLVSGYFSQYRLSDLLYDLYRMDEADQRRHGELISSAYAAALDLTFEEEAIMDAAMQQLASQDNMASPPAVYDALSGVEGFRGFYVDKLKGRIGTLKSLEAADSVALRELLAQPRGSIVDLSGPGTLRTAELGAALLVAKLVATVERTPPGEHPSFVLLNSAHRVFKALPRTLHGSRLFTAMLANPITGIFTSSQLQALSPLVVEACPVRILSADAWDQREGERRRWSGQQRRLPIRGDKPSPPAPVPVLPNSFVIEDGLYGIARPFVMRTFEAKAATARTGASSDPPQERDAGDPAPPESPLTRRILQDVKAYESPSIQSLVSYLSAEFPKSEIQRRIDDLENGGFIELAPRGQKSGRTILTLRLTPKGEELSRRLA